MLGNGILLLALAGWIVSRGETVHTVLGGLAALGALAVVSGAVVEIRHIRRNRD